MSTPDADIALRPVRTRERRNSDASSQDSDISSIDVDDFLRPDDGELRRLPDNRPPTPERQAHRRERKRAYSLASGAASTHKLSKAGRRALRRLGLATGSSQGSSSTSSSSSSSNQTSSSRLSRFSSISWPRWRFWRDSSSSGSSSSGSDDGSDDDFVPLDPVYTCLIPSLHASPLPALHSTPLPHHAAYHVEESSQLQDALDHLARFWASRSETEHQAGDLGEAMPSASGLQAPPARVPLVTRKSTAGVPRLISAPKRQPYEGSSWWLDILSPTIQDMRLLRKIFPLHPLTIEDILHQDPREKFDTFEAALGYQFIVFRAIDEAYFQYQEHDHAHNRDIAPALRTKGRLVIVEGTGGKEGVEGVRAGAINMYLVVYEDGIISFHFEPLDKHIHAVREKIQRVGTVRTIKPQWIAYSLMDSVVDAFFPLIGYMEEELKLIDGFLADPISAITNTVNHTSKGHRPLDSKLNPLHHLPLAQFWSRFPWLLDWLPAFVWRESRQFVNGKGGRVSTATLGKSKNLGKVISASMSSSSPFQPKILLQRVAQSRKLATVLAKLLLPKRDVVRGMRKRNLGLGEISLYLGDLEDHIYTLKQNLVFFEVILNHDHPVLTGLLRLAADAAKNHNDKLLYRIYIVTLLFLGSTATTGVFSMNADVPHNGDRERHLRADGTRPPPIVFGLVLIPVACVLAILWAYVRFAWHAVLKGHRKKREVRY